jgi:hypothetical protein
MRNGHTWLRIVGVIVILAGVILVGMYAFKQNEEAESMPTIEGEVACLPLKSGEKVDEASCTKGLKNKAGLYLAVESVPQSELTLGEKASVEGNLKPVTDDKSKYTISGTILGK